MRLCSVATALVVALLVGAATKPCPPQGDGRNENERALNVLKNRDSAPKASEIDAAITLAALLAAGEDSKRFNPDHGASITGYVVGVVPGGIESCNCHSQDVASRDTHIYVAADAKHTDPTQCVVVEVTPRFRSLHDGWDTLSLRAALKGKIVTFTGWMLFDSEHWQNALNTNPSNKKDWRATAWELHPVSAINVQ